MIHRYNSFTEDLLLEKIVNESMIYYTKDFKDSLLKLVYQTRDKKSLIAQNLLEVEYTDVKPDMTFISLADNEGDIKFTQFKKAFSLIKKGVEGRRYSEDSTKSLLDAIEQKLSDGSISQSDINNLFTDPHYELSTKSRNSTGIGRLVNQIFPGKYSSKEVEEFVNNFKNINKPSENKFLLVKGEDIRKYYLFSNYEQESSDLGNSCMRYTRCQEYLDIYVENPNQVQLLVYLNEEDKVLGRALLWVLNDEKSDDIEGAEYFLDRIYGIDDSIKKLFQDHAETQGWAWRTKSGYSDTKYITYKGEEHSGVKMSIELDKYDFNYYPYMDTFKELDNSESKLYNNDDEDRNWTLNHTDGTYEDNNGVWSDYHDRRIPEDEAVYSDWEDTYILRNQAVEVTLGSRRYRGWYPEDHNALVYDEFREEYINEDDAVYSEFLDKSFFNEDEEYIITWVDDDIYSHAYNKFRGDNELVSDQWTSGNVISTRKMDCYSYLEYNDIHSSIYDQIVSLNERDDYYFNDLKVEVYETEDGLLSEEDFDILGIKPSGKSYTTDELAYLFRNPNLERILEAANEEKSKLENTLSGKQSRLKFEDDEDYIKKVEQKIRKLNWRIEVLEDWIE
jgi:hypothetical protein